MTSPSQSVSDSRCLTVNVCGWAHRGPGCGFLVFWLQIAIEPFALFHLSVLIICVSLWYFTDEVQDIYEDRTYICNLVLNHNLKARFLATENTLSPPPPHPPPLFTHYPTHPASSFLTDSPKAVPLLQFFFVCSSVISYLAFVVSLLFFIYPSFVVSSGVGVHASWLWHFLGMFTYICACLRDVLVC